MDNFKNSTQLTYFSNSTLFFGEKCVHDLFTEQAKLNPEKIAVKFNQNYITYFDLNKKSDYLATLIRSKSFGSNPLVGIAIDRSIDLIIAILGILKSGGACVPLDMSYPENRLSFMVKDSGVNILLTTKKIITSYPYLKNFEKNHLFFYLDLVNFQTNYNYSNDLQNFSNLNDLMYILYTSGSTGQPKGVAMPHLALSNLIGWHLSSFDSEKISNTLQFSPISFDVAFQEIFSTLCAGQTLVLLTDEIRKDPHRLFELVKREAISRMFLPVVALQQFAEAAKNREPLSALNTVITAGEQLKITPDIELLFESMPEACLYNHYGPTETHVVASYKLSKENKKWPKLPPIGFPILNVKIYILDENLNKVEVGKAGEAYIGGECLAKGYHNRPELTKERFVPNPFGTGVLYKTGDLVCSQLDGTINFLGRIDRQIKIRGFRVELGEIEVALVQHPNIKECVVAAYEFEMGYKNLIAYIVLNTEFESKLDIFKQGGFDYKMAPRSLFFELQRYLNKVLPVYMVPSSFAIIHEIPLTPSGKVDSAALPLPLLLNTDSLVNFIKISQKTLEEKIKMIWEELLQIRPIASNENFFDLGGHSLLLVSLHKVLSEVLDYQFPIISLFKNPTIESLITYFSENDQDLISYEKIKTSRKDALTLRLSNQRKNIRRQTQERNNLNE